VVSRPRRDRRASAELEVQVDQAHAVLAARVFARNRERELDCERADADASTRAKKSTETCAGLVLARADCLQSGRRDVACRRRCVEHFACTDAHEPARSVRRQRIGENQNRRAIEVACDETFDRWTGAEIGEVGFDYNQIGFRQWPRCGDRKRVDDLHRELVVLECRLDVARGRAAARQGNDL